MLLKAKMLTGYSLQSLDGEIGTVKEFYFDDHHWTIRYLVVDTGAWLPGRQVLISPHALTGVNEAEKHITVKLTKKQIEDSPSLDSDKPVSRQYEVQYYGYYGWPAYWSGRYNWGASPGMGGVREAQKEATRREETWDPNLRSTADVTGHHIQAIGGEIGHVEDFIIDDETWSIRYLVVDTKNWWPGKKVLVSPKWIESVSWSESEVFVKLSREDIKKAPEYTDKSLLTREFEVNLHQHYKRQGYWDSDPDLSKPSL